MKVFSTAPILSTFGIEGVMCNGKGSAVGAEIAAIVFLVLGAFISIGAMAGPYKIISAPEVTSPTGTFSCKALKFVYLASSAESSVGDAITKETYASAVTASCGTTVLPEYCVLVKNAANNGNAAVAMFAIALLMSLGSAVFISLRVVRLRQNLLRSSDGPGAAQAAPKGCHTRAAASVTLSVLSFVLMLVAAITVWVGVLPLAAWTFASSAVFNCLLPRTVTFADGPGAACAGIVIFTSFMGMVLDASSHCCCKSTVKAVPGPTTVVVVPPMQQAYMQQQPHFGGGYGSDPHRATVFAPSA